MKILTAVLIAAAKRAFTKSNGAVVSTKSLDGVWDLEATLAWFLRGLFLIALLYIAGRLEVDATVLMSLMNA
jgi:hypothetical protein